MCVRGHKLHITQAHRVSLCLQHMSSSGDHFFWGAVLVRVQGWFGETPSWHDNPAFLWHRVASALPEHYLGLSLCQLGLPLEQVSTTLPTHCHAKKPQHVSTNPKVLKFYKDMEKMMPPNVIIMQTPWGYVCLSCPGVCHGWKPFQRGQGVLLGSQGCSYLLGGPLPLPKDTSKIQWLLLSVCLLKSVETGVMNNTGKWLFQAHKEIVLLLPKWYGYNAVKYGESFYID